MTNSGSYEIYVHIPFCVRKCNYCDFLSFAADDEAKESYVKALIDEIGAYNGYEGVSAASVYFGGGTPSILKAQQLRRITKALRARFNIASDAEITIEVNPGTASCDKIEEIADIGFNRVSIGLQSVHDDELRMLGRIHDYRQFEECYSWIRDAGFDNVSIDIMTALPGQNAAKLTETLERIIKLRPEHVSAYSLIIEEGTPFYEKYGDIDGPVIGEEEERRLYALTNRLLAEAGYEHYEISNYARPGYESRHNCGYWTGVPYIGFGLGASSFTPISNEYEAIRSKNTSNMELYIGGKPHDNSEDVMLTKEELMSEVCFLGLRMRRGVSYDDFFERFGIPLREVYGSQIDKLVRDGLLIGTDDNITLSDMGIDYGNYVFSHFI